MSIEAGGGFLEPGCRCRRGRTSEPSNTEEKADRSPYDQFFEAELLHPVF